MDSGTSGNLSRTGTARGSFRRIDSKGRLKAGEEVTSPLVVRGESRSKLTSRSSAKKSFDSGSPHGTGSEADDEVNAIDELLMMPDANAGKQNRNLSLWEQASWRDWIYAVADPGSFPSDIPRNVELMGYLSAAVTFFVIILNCLSVMGETYPEYELEPLPVYWVAIETICVAYFTVDIILRFVTCPSRMDFLKDMLNWIDILAIAPFYVEIFTGLTFAPWLRMLRVIRLARIVRVLKTANVMGLNAVLVALQESFSGMFLFVAMSGTALLIFATIIYFTERGEFNKDEGVWYRPCLRYELHCAARNMTEPSPFQSIPDAFWYTIVTMGTVGFGDVTPKTGVGQFLGVWTMLSGVFVIAFPTMLLSGHYDAAARVTRVVRRTFEQIRARHLDRKMPSRLQLRHMMGWADTIEEADYTKMRIAHGEEAEKAGAADPRLPVAVFRFQGKQHYLRVHKEQKRFYYEPLLHLLRDDDGSPLMRVVWSKCGMPTLVQISLLLDHPDARVAASTMVKRKDGQPIGTDIGGGFSVRHHSPFFDDGDEEPLYKMQSVKARAGYRGEMFPIYFERIPRNHSTDAVFGNEMIVDDSYLSEKAILEEAAAALLGTSLFIQMMLPGRSVRKRITIVTQMFQNTRLHRELKLIAVKSDDEAKEMTAYAAHDDIVRLLHEVHKKVDLYNDSLCLEHVHRVDRDIAEILMGRLRSMRIVHVPPALKQGIYNGDLLEPDDFVYEIPISLFDPDDEDDVEEDALGYLDVMASPFLGHCHRVDLDIDPTVTGTATQSAMLPSFVGFSNTALGKSTGLW